MSWGSQQQPPGVYPNQPGMYAQQPAKPAPTSGKALFSLILGIGSFCLALFTGIPAVILGMLAIRDINRSQGQVGGKGLAIGGIVCGSVGTLLMTAILGCFVAAIVVPAVQMASGVASGEAVREDLKEITLSFHNYHDVHNSFPKAGVEGGSVGGAGLSWRVHILPFLGYRELYDQFRLDEPWDSPHNIALLEEMPDEYKSSEKLAAEYKTTYLAVVPGPGMPPNLKTAMMPEETSRFRDIVDGMSNTIMLVHAKDQLAVEWTRPRDYKVNWNDARIGLAEVRAGFYVGFADGSTRLIPNTVSDNDIRNMMGRNDGQLVNFY